MIELSEHEIFVYRERVIPSIRDFKGTFFGKLVHPFEYVFLNSENDLIKCDSKYYSNLDRLLNYGRGELVSLGPLFRNHIQFMGGEIWQEGVSSRNLHYLSRKLNKLGIDVSVGRSLEIDLKNFAGED